MSYEPYRRCNYRRIILIKTQGFTLIELIIVIVILGVFAVTAAPKFIDFSSDARIATLESIEGNIKATMSLVHTKALVLGLTEGAQVLTLDNGEIINLIHGLPAPADLEKVLDISGPILTVTSDHFPNYPVLVYYFTGNLNPEDNSPPFPLPNQGTDCFVMYSVSKPNITPFAGTRIMSNGC